MQKKDLSAKIRSERSKSATNTMRKSGWVPGVFYSKAHEPISIDVSEKEIKTLVFTSEAHAINLMVDDGRTFDAILKDTQFHPVTGKVIHFDLLGLVAGQTITVDIPLLFVGSPIGVRQGGMLQEFLHKLEVECLPSDMPEHITIDISGLKVGNSIHIRDLNVPNVSFMQPEESLIVAVNAPRTEASETAGEEGTAEPEVISKGKKEEE